MCKGVGWRCVRVGLQTPALKITTWVDWGKSERVAQGARRVAEECGCMPEEWGYIAEECGYMPGEHIEML